MSTADGSGSLDDPGGVLKLSQLKRIREAHHYSAKASNFGTCRGTQERKSTKVVESRTKFPYDVKRVLDSTTVLVLDSTPIFLL